MTKGEKCILRCRSDYAYGDSGQGQIPAGASLDFEVELLDFDEYANLETGLKWKKIVRSDGEFETPDDESTCIISYKASLAESDELFASGETITYVIGMFSFSFWMRLALFYYVHLFAAVCLTRHLIGEEDGFPQGVDKALQEMHKGETCEFIIDASPLGYGSAGNSDLKIPPGANLKYEIILHEIQKVCCFCRLLLHTFLILLNTMCVCVCDCSNRINGVWQRRN